MLKILKKIFASSIILLSSYSYGAADLLDPGGMTQVMDGPNYDDTTAHISLGHNFPYFGQTFTDVWMSSNGFLILYDPTANVGNSNYNNSYCCNGKDLANATYDIGAFSYMIAPLWTDLIDKTVGADSGYFYKTNENGSAFLWYNVHEFYNNNTNTFQVDMYADGSFDFIYDEVDITQHSTFIGFTGDITSSSDDLNQLQYSGAGFDEFDIDFHDETITGGRAWYGDDGGYGNVDCSNALNDTSCPGYADAYFSQQCSNDSLYDSQCPGYAEAYYSQQCSADALYDSQCPGYAEAYYSQQCNADPLYDTECPGYDDAYFDQQCTYDPQYDFQCPGYVEDVFEDPVIDIVPSTTASMDTGDDGSSFNEFGIEEETENYAPEAPIEEQFQVPPMIQEEIEPFEEPIEEIVEEIAIIVEEAPIIEEELEVLEDLEIIEVLEEAIIEKPVAKTKKSSTRRDNSLAISISVNMANNLVRNLEQTAISEGEQGGNTVSSNNSSQNTQNSSNSQGTMNSMSDSSSLNSTGSSTFAEFFSEDTALFVSMTGENVATGADGASESDQTAVTTEDVGQNVALGDAAPIGFAIIPPPAPEMQVEVVETKSLAERLADQVAEKNRENSNSMAVGQTAQIANLAAGTDVSAYYNAAYTESSAFYQAKEIYGNVRMTDNFRTHYNMFSTNHGKMYKLIRSQYERSN